MTSGIYEIRNRANGKRYIGSAMNLRHRWSQHLANLRHKHHQNPHLQAAFDKHGEEAFCFEILEETKPETLIECEQHYFDLLKPEYNIASVAGSFWGCHHSAETRKKISLALRNTHPSKATRQKMSEAQRGKCLSREHRRRISVALSGPRAPMYGKHHSEKTKRRISEAKKGHLCGEETRQKLSRAWTPERRQRQSAWMKEFNNQRRRCPKP